jgi:hypothetical protein
MTVETASITKKLVHTCDSFGYLVTVTRVQTVCAIGLKVVEWHMDAFSAGETESFVTIFCGTRKSAKELAEQGPRYW